MEIEAPNQCYRTNSMKFEDMTFVNVSCQILPGITCEGNKKLFRTSPCIMHGEKRYQTALFLSIFFGFLGLDRLYLGYSLLGFFKMGSLGFFGIAWVTDVYKLIHGTLLPADLSNWTPYII
ncbi:hypothetical protein MXB_664 [Myxobolus squamalis]|nr:hypothetical protein MXB_664 [Myxobolus squamalis]